VCLIIFAYKTHPDYDLILAANRDEQYKRPTRAAQFWQEYPDVLAGKDLSAGGTWLGINRQRHFAALTNYRDPSINRENPPTRGKIVLDYLVQKKKPEDYLIRLNEISGQYMGFNLLLGTPEVMFHYSNQQKKINRVEPGVHGLSNHLLDTPWPKVQQAKTGLLSLIKQNEVSPESLFELLQNDQPASPEKLPNTGIPRELEKNLSPIFIKTELYGTRNSTVLLIGKNGTVSFEEHRFKPHTMEITESNRFEYPSTG
jgi:uncharacterized protein with NRDE domain